MITGDTIVRDDAEADRFCQEYLNQYPQAGYSTRFERTYGVWPQGCVKVTFTRAESCD